MREKFKKFYENLIDDISDEEVRDKMLERLEAIDDEIFELDYDIEKEIENQEIEYYDSFALEDEFNYQSRMPMVG